MPSRKHRNSNSSTASMPVNLTGGTDINSQLNRIMDNIAAQKGGKHKNPIKGSRKLNTYSEYIMTGGKRKSKSSKKSSKSSKMSPKKYKSSKSSKSSKKSKKGSKRMGRELPPALKVYQQIVSKVKADILKQGIELKGVTLINSFVGKYSQMAKKASVSLDKLEDFIMEKYEADKKAGKLKQMLADIEKESAEKRAAKKAAKSQM